MKRFSKVKHLFLAVFGMFLFEVTAAQVTGVINVKGDLDKFYVVTFKDGGWSSNVATELELGRSYVGQDTSWRGSFIGKFRFHVTNNGSGSEFIDADLREANNHFPALGYFVASWRDISFDNNSANIVIWLRGNTTYNYRSNFAVTPVVYDGSSAQNPLIYQPGGTIYSVRAAVDQFVNTYGMTYSSTAYFNGTGVNYFGGSLGIGTRATGQYKLAVEGTARARRVKVDQETWADFVFEPEYKLPSLQEVEAYIKEHKHLPDVPSAAEVAIEKLDLGEMNKLLLQKIEELTLHLIEQEKRSKVQEVEIRLLKERIALISAYTKRTRL